MMKDERNGSQKYYVPALEKGLDILEALSFSPVGQTLSELAAGMNRTTSELFRMLNALERRRYIERDPVSGKYSLTLGLYQLAHTHSPIEKLLRAAAVPMKALAERVKESCHVSTLNDGRLLVLAQADSLEIYRFSVEVGSSYSCIHTASGPLLLAHLQEEAFEHFCETSLDYRKLDVAARKALLIRLHEIRRKGVSTARDEPVIGVRSYAVLVGKPEVDILAALAVASLDIRGKKHNPAKVVDALRETAAEINRAIGLRP